MRVTAYNSRDHHENPLPVGRLDEVRAQRLGPRRSAVLRLVRKRLPHRTSRIDNIGVYGVGADKGTAPSCRSRA